MNEKKQWGGRRTGAGRKATSGNVATIGLRIPADVEEILSRQENRTAFIIEAIREYDRRHNSSGINVSSTKGK
ncbi:MAG: hypothetical protein K2O24_00765 [Muribaculaceae bacterium]|nr:hypothetical protein [Muribaculaceae bacterium]